ncbi:MAG: MBL fold metallo-hydrolase [Alphaproteobacteria bacterium]|nr:MBL fold metallo-hydrolase [Alphaproteobacteria bacterium]
MLKSIKLLALVGCAVIAVAAAAHAQDTKRGLTEIKGDVYRFQNKFHFSMVVVTQDGVVVTDPINADAAAWLKNEIANRFNKPITHLIYSHSHLDHASGGAVFADGTKVIAQANAPEQIDGVAPTERFDDKMVVETGGKTIELTFLGKGHGDDLIAMVVRPENVAFVVDAVSVRRLVYRDFPRVDIDGLVEQIKVVEGLDFEVLAPGHGALGDKAHVPEAREYVEALRAEVLAGLKAGKSEDTLAQEITMDAYKDWGQYEAWRELNVRGMARWLVKTGAAN